MMKEKEYPRKLSILKKTKSAIYSYYKSLIKIGAISNFLRQIYKICKLRNGILRDES